MGTDGTSPSVTETIVIEFCRLAEPIREALDIGRDGVIELLDSMHVGESLTGQELEETAELLEEAVSGPVQTLDETVLTPLEAGTFPDLDHIDDIATAIGDLVDGLTILDELEFSGDVEDLGELVLDYLILRYLHRYHNRTYNVLCIAGVIVEHDTDSPTELRLSELNQLVTDPSELFQESFKWGEKEFEAFSLLYYLKWVLKDVGIPAELYDQTTEQIQSLHGSVPEELSGTVEQELRIPILTVLGDDGALESGVKLVPLPSAPGNSLPGLAIVPFGKLEFGEEIPIADDWVFNSELSAETTDWGLVVRPEQEPDVKTISSDAGDENETRVTPAEIHARSEVRYDPSTTGSDEELTLIGAPDGSRLAIRSLSGRVIVDYDSAEIVFVVEVPLSGTIGVAADDFDGFLSEVIPGDGLFYDFDVTVGWSSETGLYFERGGTLEASLPVGERIGPALLEEIYLSIGTPETDSAAQPNASPAAMHIVGAASASIELGPIVGTIRRMGVSADVSFPENADGNLGPIDLDMGFEPPDGIGLVVDAGGVTGGGYLEFDHENERYAGTLQLHIGDLVLSAVGLLTTRLPDGSSGFSLLVIIAGEFTPVQLGLGFTLNGVGGLLGINRSFRAEPLGEAVREGSLDSVLFPVDPVANAQRIISDLRAIFPPTRDVHVFGPMAKLGYGTPAMVTADLAVLLEIPTFKLAVLGRLRARLPDEEAPLVILNMDVAGVLDPPGQRASIDASLFDSRIGAYTVSGDMAMRTSWGENPRFVLSVGGFHPRFEPPADFPALRRVRVGIGEPGGNPSIDLNGYMALTSNTAQVGAGASFRAKAGPAKVEGKLAFDALFEFDPFRFVIDFLVHVSVRVYGKGLSVRVDGTLSGTSPWRVKGRVSIDLWLIEVNASISLTLGEKDTRAPLPAARVMPLLAESISNPSNWAAQLPPRGRTSVTLREVKATPDEVLVHPLGRLSVRQTVVPLEFPIETFRRATPGDFTRFSITGVTIEGTGDGIELGESTTEQFAPAQFLNLTDDQKLDSPAFEPLEAGRQVSTDGLGADVPSGSQRALLTYETSVVDREEVVYGRRLRNLGAAGTMLVGQTWAMTEALAETSAVAKAQRQAIGPGRTAPVVDVTPGAERDEPTHRIDARTGALTGRIRLNEETYAIADARTMEPVDPASMRPVTVAVAGKNAMPKSEAKRTLSRYEATHPADAGLYRVVAMHRLRSAAAARSA